MNLPCILVINVLFIFSIVFSLCNSILHVEGKQSNQLVSRRLLTKHTSSLASKKNGYFHSGHQDGDIIRGHLQKQGSGPHKQDVPHHYMHQLYANYAISPPHSYKAQLILAPSLNKNTLSNHISKPSMLAPLLHDNVLSHQYRTILVPSLVKDNLIKPRERGLRSYRSQLLELEKANTMGKTKSSQDRSSKASAVAFHMDYQLRQTHPPSNN